MLKKFINTPSSFSAFSIVEAIVSLAITAIIMGILFVIFSIITESMLDFKNQNQLVNDLNRLTYSINKDIFEKESINVLDNSIIFKGYTGESVKYSFLEKYIVRSSETFVDSFKINTKQIVVDTIKGKTERLIFQKIKLNVEVNENTTDLKFYKRIHVNELLKNKIQ